LRSGGCAAAITRLSVSKPPKVGKRNQTGVGKPALFFVSDLVVILVDLGKNDAGVYVDIKNV
jgi:hypothetical protein